MNGKVVAAFVCGVALMVGWELLADSTPLQIRQANSLVRDGVTPDSPTYGMVVAGYTGSQVQFLSLDADGNMQAETALTTALDATIDSIAIYGQSSSQGDTALTVTTTQADNLADSIDTLNVSSLSYAYDASSGNWDRIRTSGIVAGGLNVALYAGGGSLLSATAQGTSDNFSNGSNALATDAALRIKDTSGTLDVVRTSHFIGYPSFPSAACTVVTVTGAVAACGTLNHGTVGSTYQIQSNTRAICRAEEDATSPAVAVTTDMPVDSPGVYYWTPASTSTDTICCDTTAGDAEVRICEVTFP